MAASTFTWAGITASWSATNSWVGDVAPGSLSTDVILFDGSNTFTSTVDLNLNFPPDRLIITNPNATLVWADGEDLELTGVGANSGLQMSAGTITISVLNGALFGMNTGLISGGRVNIGPNGEVDIEKNGTLTLTSTGSISLTGGELDIGLQTQNFGTLTSGLVYINGGEALITGGNLSGLAFTIDTSNFNGGVFNQSAGGVNILGLASFLGGTNTVSGTGVFQGGTIAIGTNFTLNGGTVQARSGGAGITLAASRTLTMGTGATTATLDGTNGGFTNAGTIIGQGFIRGAIGGSGLILASGGILDVTNSQSGDSFNIDTLASSELKFDGSSNTGGTVQFNGATVGVIGFGNASALSGFTDRVANLGIASSATSVSGDNFININAAVTIGDIKVVGGTGHQFSGSANQFILYTDATDVTALGTITLASAPASGIFVNWNADSIANGGALGGTDVFLSTIACYAAGTLIGTDRGDVAVEDLSAGDTIVTLQNGQAVSKPVKWIGLRKLDVAAHPQPHMAAPVRIRAGAFGDDLPRRDLLVSPAHAIYVDGKLVPANLLINNMTIVQELETKSVTYYHVELDQHALILAEGLVSESYLDTGNRAIFSNAGLAVMLHPEFHVNAGLKQWDEDACAPLAIDAETIAPIWHMLANRAETLGYVPPRFTTTQDADLYLEANGRRLRPVAVAQGRHTFMLPAGTGDIVLRSRTSAPADLDPLSGDWRPLGVAVRAMTLRVGDDHIVIPADHPALTQGWHTAEAANGAIWRWTAGSATIPMQTTAGPAMLDIDVGPTTTYILARSDRQDQRIAA